VVFVFTTCATGVIVKIMSQVPSSKLEIYLGSLTTATFCEFLPSSDFSSTRSITPCEKQRWSLSAASPHLKIVLPNIVLAKGFVANATVI
jgi:hypothetical protein